VPTLKEIHEKYPKDVAITFVNQPLSFHPFAQGAAIAGLAAHRQGKFWEMHDKMFANQQALTVADLEKYAGEVGLNMAKFRKDFTDPALKGEILADQARATGAGANGTPTFFVNGRKVVGAKPFADFKTVIDEEIKKADDLIKSGTPLAQVAQKLTDQAPSDAPPPAAAAPSAPEPPEFVKNVAIGNAPAKGPSGAKVQLVIFSDFQCPFCDKVRPTIKQIEDEYKGKIRIAFKQLPIKFHANAQVAAEASLAANEQGKFWEMHDKLYDNQNSLDRLSIEKYAQELKLNMTKFRAALDSGKFKQQITNDLAEASATSTTSTPTFFINGHRLIGTQPYGAFKKLIDDELKKDS
jgi:protein-disulfide isomerase